jgi:hypothetical protein
VSLIAQFRANIPTTQHVAALVHVPQVTLRTIQHSNVYQTVHKPTTNHHPSENASVPVRKAHTPISSKVNA